MLQLWMDVRCMLAREDEKLPLFPIFHSGKHGDSAAHVESHTQTLREVRSSFGPKNTKEKRTPLQSDGRDTCLGDLVGLRRQICDSPLVFGLASRAHYGLWLSSGWRHQRRRRSNRIPDLHKAATYRPT